MAPADCDLQCKVYLIPLKEAFSCRIFWFIKEVIPQQPPDNPPPETEK